MLDVKLFEKYVDGHHKIDVINGLLIAQSICARRILDGGDQPLLNVMDDIITAIKTIKGEEL